MWSEKRNRSKQDQVSISFKELRQDKHKMYQNVSKCQLIWALWQSSRIRSPSGSRRLHQNAMRNDAKCKSEASGPKLIKPGLGMSRLNLWAPKSASLKILIGVLLQILQEGLKFSTGKGPRKPDENSTLVYAPVVFSIAVSFPVGCSACISCRYFPVPVPVKMHRLMYTRNASLQPCNVCQIEACQPNVSDSLHR